MSKLVNVSNRYAHILVSEDFTIPAEIDYSLINYFQSAKDSEVDHSLYHFAQKTCTSCDDDRNNIFSLETLNRKIDRMEIKTIGEYKASPFVLKRCKTALCRQLLIILRKSFSDGMAPKIWIQRT